MKERNLGTIISIVVHLCAISLLMVPSLAVQNRPLNVIEVDFSLARNPLKKVSTSNDETKMIKKKQRILKNEKVPKEMVGPDGPIGKTPETIPAKEQVMPIAAPAVAAASNIPSDTDIHLASETSSERAIGTLSSAQGETIVSGVAETHTGYSAGSAGVSPAQNGSIVDVEGSNWVGGQQDKESLAEGSEDYNYIRDAVMRSIRYPEKARRLGFQGKVLLSFVVLENGTTSEIRVVNSSSYRILDESAKEAVSGTRIAKKVAYRVAVRLPIAYKLQGAKHGRM